MSTSKPVTPPVPSTSSQQQQKSKTPELASEATSGATPAMIFRQQPEDLDVTRNNEATNEFQAKTIELRNQRPQWITYYQYVYFSMYQIWNLY